jgi:hypothetical protein
LLVFTFALRFQVGLLRSQFQDLVPRIFPSLLCIGEIAAAILQVAARRKSLR